MVTRLTVLVALLGLLAPGWTSAARADDCTDAVDQYVQDLGGRPGTYTVTEVSAAYVDAVFPYTCFVEVIFRQYPIAILAPQGLSASNVFAVDPTGVYPLTTPDDLMNYFYSWVFPVGGEDDAVAVGESWGRLSEVYTQDMFYRFTDPAVQATTFGDGSIEATGSVDAIRPSGTGSLFFTLDFDPNGVLDNIAERRTFRPGPRPICQATKLLDKDPIVRRMAEDAILVMGSRAKFYLDEQRKKASPELKKAIDRVWQRIVDEGW
jgi:hypothetical protein